MSAERVTLFNGCQHITSLQLLHCVAVAQEPRAIIKSKAKNLCSLAMLSQLSALTGLCRLVLDVKGPAVAYKAGRPNDYYNGVRGQHCYMSQGSPLA
jgi:hypothetical protein